MNISQSSTTAYHPQSNGLVERFHRRLKEVLRAHCAVADWHTHLPWVMLGIRATWCLDGSFSPAEAVYGAQPVLPGQFLAQPEPPASLFLDELQDLLAGRTPRATAHNCAPAPPQLPEELLRSRFVLVRQDAAQSPLQPLYDGPYLVLERSLRTFKLQIGERTDNVSTSHLKACQVPPDAAAAPPRRGRLSILRPPGTAAKGATRHRVRLQLPPLVVPPAATPGRPVHCRRPPDRFSAN